MQTKNLIKRSPGLYRCGSIGDDHPRVDHESVESSPNWFAYRLIERAACRSDRTKSNETNRDPWRSRLVVDLDVALKVTSSNAFVASHRETRRRQSSSNTGVAFAKNFSDTLASRVNRDNEEMNETRRDESSVDSAPQWRGSKKRGRFADQEYDATLVKASAKKRLPYCTECRSR
ncbi:hypothetical protein QLX08_003639 [Tetragonisca angustula]|uniref:Uncharacterized protein n=1 Tax=Tetragonisca angustula TaxID=166442 RepID=A0AAW1A6A6_9HYME